MTIAQRLQILMDLVSNEILTPEQAIDILEQSCGDQIGDLPMETTEVDLP